MSDIEIPDDARDRQERQVGLTIAILAILLAVVSALGNEQDNEKIVKQIEASNGFAWYQSKRIRAGMNELMLDQMKVELAGNRVAGVSFAKAGERLEVRARLTIDASDWGDVIQLSGAKWSAGPDAKARFGEPSAPEQITDANRHEMNPLTWCVVVRGSAKEGVIPEPPGFDPRRYFGCSRETREEFQRTGWPKGVLFMNVPAFADTTHPAGPYSPPVNIYTHRRLVDAAHNQLPHEREVLFFNWPPQDYPTDVWPKSVADALDATEPGASKKNLVALTPAQRRIVFEDAKRHSLGLLHHVQKLEPRFRGLELTDEFGTPDRRRSPTSAKACGSKRSPCCVSRISAPRTTSRAGRSSCPATRCSASSST